MMTRKPLHRITALLLILTLTMTAFPLLPASAATMNFTKVTGWAAAEVDQAVGLGLVPPRLAGTDLTRPATREELCEIAVLLYEKKMGAEAAPKTPNPFTDTTNVSVLKALGLGITAGTSATLFSPGASTNREQVATMFGRTIRLLYPSANYATESAPAFGDAGLIASWAIDHVRYMAMNEIIKGANGLFMPRPATPAQTASGYGMTSREQAIAIARRIHDTWGSPDTLSKNVTLATREKHILSMIKGTETMPSEQAALEALDLSNRPLFRPTWHPKLTLEAIDPLTGKASTVPFATRIPANGTRKGTFRWSLPADVQASAARIVWQVSSVPFDGQPVTTLSAKPSSLLLSGTVDKTVSTFEIDFASVRQADDRLRHPSRVQFTRAGGLRFSSLTRFVPDSPATQADLAPRAFYVRAYPATTLGAGIGDAGTGLAVIDGDSLPAHTFSASTVAAAMAGASGSGTVAAASANAHASGTASAAVEKTAPPSALSMPADRTTAAFGGLVNLPTLPLVTPTLPLITPSLPDVTLPSLPTPGDFKLRMALNAGKITYGGEFPNNFEDKSSVTLTTADTSYSILPATLPAGTTELRVQVSLAQPDYASDSWRAPAGLVYETSLFSTDAAFVSLSATRSPGMAIDLTKFVPPADSIKDKELIHYYVRVSALQPGSIPGETKALFSNTVSLYYGKPQAPDIVIYEQVKLDPHLPQITSVQYTPVQWEKEGWQYRYEVTRQPTKAEVFGTSLVGNGPYAAMPVGAKLDMTPQPDDDSWFEDMLDAVSDFFSDVTGFLADVTNWVSKAYANLKTGLVAFVANNLPLVPESLRDELQAALTLMVDTGLASIGIPPSLPNFDELSGMGVDYLATVALQQAGVPVDATSIEAAKSVGGAIAQGASSAATTGGAPNPMNWNFVRQDPDYLYRPAYVMIELYNPWSEPTPVGTLSGDAMTCMDTSKVGTDNSIGWLYARYGSSWLTLFKPVRGQTIPSLAPGQRLKMPIFLEEYVGLPFYEGGAPVDRDSFRLMYHTQTFDFNFFLQYDLPSPADMAKARGMTNAAIYSYTAPGQNIAFTTKPTQAYAR